MAFLVLVFSVASACVQDLLFSSTDPVNSFAQVLEGAVCTSVRVSFLTSTPWTAPVSSLGRFASIELQCAGGTLEITQTLIVEVGTVARFQECGIVSKTSAAVFSILGKTVLSECWMNHLTGVGFQVTGQLTVTTSHFQGNTNSLFSVTVHGFTLSVTDSVFTANSSPQGSVFYWNPSSSLANSTTSVVFANCEFRGNSASMLGAAMFISLPLATYLTSTQLEETRTLSVTNCSFFSSTGVLLYLQLRSVNTTFRNNTFEDVENPVQLALYDNSFSLLTSRMRLSGRPFLCTYVGGVVLIDGLEVLGVSNGPALLLANKAVLGAGQVVLRNVDLAGVSQVDMSWFVSTVYSLATVVSVDNLLVRSGFSFAAGCGVYFVSVSSVTNCSVTNTTVVQGGLIGSVFGAGIARNIRLVDCPTLSGGCIYTLGSLIDYSNVTFSVSNPTMMPSYSGLYSFVDGTANLTDVSTTMFSSTSQSLIIVINGEYCITRMRWNQIVANTFVELVLATARVEDITAGYVNVSNFATITIKSTFWLKDVTLIRPNFYGTIVSANGFCAVFITNVTVHGGHMQSLVSSFTSNVHADTVHFSEMTIESLVYAYQHSAVEIKHLQVGDSTVNLVTSVLSNVTLRDAQLINLKVYRRLLELREVSLVLEAVFFQSIFAITNSPFCRGKFTQLTVTDCVFSVLNSWEQGMVKMTDSDIEFRRTVLQNCNVTFLELTRTNFHIEDSRVVDAGLFRMDSDVKTKITAGFLHVRDSSGFIERSDFTRVSGMNGGSFWLSGSALTVQDSNFTGCYARESGGVLYSDRTSLTIRNSVFANNSAVDGGSLYFACESEFECTCNIAWSKFSHGKAVSGAVVKWTKVRPDMMNLTKEGNTAEYGEFEASLPTHLTLLNSETQIMQGVPGAVVTQPILIGFLDAIGQLVRTDNLSSAELLSSKLLGTTYVAARSGVARFSGVIVQVRPGSSVTIRVFSESINRTFPGSPESFFVFQYRALQCSPGAVESDQGCYQCPAYSFSVNPQEGECRPCPSYATCPGGMELQLDTGYWRSSEYSSEVYLCPVQSSCRGGQNSTCAEGYSDKLCAKCSEGYYLTGLSACILCESEALRVGRLLLFITAVSTAYVIFIWKTPTHTSEVTATSVLTTFKIMMNYLDSMVILSIITVEWRKILIGFFSSIEMFTSFSASAFILECFWVKVTPVFAKAVFASIFPICLLLLNCLVFVLLHVFRLCESSFQRCCHTSVMIVCAVHPYVVKTLMQLVACRRIDNLTLWLSADVAIECWTGSHLAYLFTVFIPTLVVYIIGVPLGLTVLLYRLRASEHRDYLIFLRSGYREQYYYWELVVTLRKALLMVILSLLSTAPWLLQNFSCMILLYICLLKHQQHTPYEDSVHNTLEFYSVFLQMALVAVSFYLNVDTKVTATIHIALGYALPVVLSAFVLICLVVVGIQAVQHRKRSRVLPQHRRLEVEVLAPPSSLESLRHEEQRQENSAEESHR